MMTPEKQWEIIHWTILSVIFAAIWGALCGATIVPSFIPLVNPFAKINVWVRVICTTINLAITVVISLVMTVAIPEAIRIGNPAIMRATDEGIGYWIYLAIHFVIYLAVSFPVHKAIGKVYNDHERRGFNFGTIALYIILTIATGILTGVGAVVGFNSYLLAGLIASALPLAGMLIYPPLKLRSLKAQYRRLESEYPNLIEP